MFVFADPRVVAIADRVQETLAPSGVVVWYLKGEFIHMIAHTNSPIDRPMKRIMSRQNSVGHLVCEMNKTLVLDDTLSHPLMKTSNVVLTYGVMAYLGTPFHLGAVPVGGISVVHQHPRRWDDSDVACLEDAAQQMSDLAENDAQNSPHKP